MRGLGTHYIKEIVITFYNQLILRTINQVKILRW